jgi:NAD(P)-dependent dehydrogenase (short-subunit alcohol dehydrogenase family)
MGRSSALLFADEGAKVVCADVSGHEESAGAEIGDGRRVKHGTVRDKPAG